MFLCHISYSAVTTRRWEDNVERLVKTYANCTSQAILFDWRRIRRWMVYPGGKSSQPPCGLHRGPLRAPTRHLPLGPILRARHRYPAEHSSRHHRAIRRAPRACLSATSCLVTLGVARLLSSSFLLYILLYNRFNKIRFFAKKIASVSYHPVGVVFCTRHCSTSRNCHAVINTYRTRPAEVPVPRNGASGLAIARSPHYETVSIRSRTVVELLRFLACRSSTLSR
jgi:hypothetical protein